MPSKGAWPRRATGLTALLLTMVVSLAVATACGGDDNGSEGNGDVEDSTGAEPPATQSADGDYPMTVTDLLDREVEIASKPESVVALSPTTVEFVYTLGETVVGRSSSATYPEAALEAGEVGTAYQPSLEAILALEPDLVLADSVVHAGPQFRDSLEQLPVPVVFAGADSYQGVIDGLNLVGTILGIPDEATAAAADIEAARDEAQAAVEGQDLSAVFLVAAPDQVLYAAVSGSFAADVLEQAGITNAAAEQPDSGPFPGYSALPPETLIQYNPDIIFTVTPGPESVPRLSTLIPEMPPLAGMDAVQQGRVVEVDVETFLEAPGPRIVEAFEAVTAAAGS